MCLCLLRALLGERVKLVGIAYKSGHRLEEYRKYQAQNLSPVEEEYLESIKNIQNIVKKKDNN